MWHELLLIDSIICWPILVVLALICSVKAHKNEWLVMSVIMCTTVAALILFTDFIAHKPWEWAQEHPYYVIGGLVGYVAIGAIWSCVFRWRMFTKKRVAEYIAYRDAWLRGKPWKLINGQLPEEAKADFKEYVFKGYSDFYKYEHGEKVLVAFKDMSEYWDDTIGRAAAWPIDMVGYFLGDFLYDFWSWVCRKMQGIMQMIANRATKDIAGDFK